MPMPVVGTCFMFFLLYVCPLSFPYFFFFSLLFVVLSVSDGLVLRELTRVCIPCFFLSFLSFCLLLLFTRCLHVQACLCLSHTVCVCVCLSLSLSLSLSL